MLGWGGRKGTLSALQACVWGTRLCLEARARIPGPGEGPGQVRPFRQVAKAWALREVWKEQGRSTYGMYTFIAQKVTKVGGGHPLPEAVKKLLENADEDLCR